MTFESLFPGNLVAKMLLDSSPDFPRQLKKKKSKDISVLFQLSLFAHAVIMLVPGMVLSSIHSTLIISAAVPIFLGPDCRDFYM